MQTKPEYKVVIFWLLLFSLLLTACNGRKSTTPIPYVEGVWKYQLMVDGSSSVENAFVKLTQTKG